MSSLNFISQLLENNIFSRFTQSNVIVGLVLLVLGILIGCLAGTITKKVRKVDKKEKVNTSDKLYLILKAVALVLVMVSLIAMIVR